MSSLRRLLLTVGLAMGLSLAAWAPRTSAGGTSAGGADLPLRVSDQDFWRMVTEFSEPNGFFRSDNLTSNEVWFQHVIPDLVGRTRPGGAYLGVGPEQNYTYMVAVKPALAFIFDIRRGNMLLQLMYKAIFELSNDRADFVSMLFSRPRPAGLGPTTTAADLFSAFSTIQASQAVYARNLKMIDDRLTLGHHLPLSTQDLGGVESVYRAFYGSGYAVRVSPTYDELMTENDGRGVNHSYLATEAGFDSLKALESKNLVIPVVGDFGGPKAIRAVGTYLKSRGATVAAFYLSNVEQYLYQDNKWGAFCRNVATLPLDASSTFIRSSSGGFGGRGPRFVSSLGAMAAETKSCAGR